MPDSKGRIRYAVVGLGWFGQEAILPGFRNARKNSVLAALVSGDAEKREQLARDYKVPAFSYEQYDELLRGGTVDAVYIALPNSMHHDYTVRAANAGVHALCEKPMADSAAACKEMIDACRRNNVRLMIAYRLHFEEANLKAAELVNSGKLGEPRLFDSVNTQQVRDDNATRLDASLGAGPVLDVGVYCINAARYLFRAEPTEVAGFQVHGNDPRFRNVPEMVSVLMRFPGDRLATFTCGFGESKVSTYRVVGTRGDLRLDPAYPFAGDIYHFLTVGTDTEKTRYRSRDQIAPEILYFSDCVLNSRDPEPGGDEGLIDVQIIEAVHESCAKGGQPVKLPPFEKRERPTPAQETHEPAVSKPDLIHAEPAGKG